MHSTYLALGLAVIALNLIAGATGAVAWLRHRLAIAFWYLLRAAQAGTLVFVLFETVLYIGGHRADDGLHYLYVLLPVIASLLAEGMRGASASQELGEVDFKTLSEEQQQEVATLIVRRETGVMTVACFVIAFLVWRAVTTDAGLF
ncbi:MAG: hypothetical protein IPK93_05555 [Solirubrobacterales bacterium]|nr:hypothetical protein [Solirubrobacterales bacterium]